MKRDSRFRAELTSDGTLELVIYGDIVDAVTAGYLESWGYDPSTFVSALSVKKALDAAGAYAKIRLRINSPGGDAFEGMAIHSLLAGQAKPVEAYIDGLAASSASVIAMAAGTRIMGRSAMMMIHNAWCSCTGYAADMRKQADVLDTISSGIAAAYVDRTGMSQEDVLALMEAETWFSAEDCVQQGFATSVVQPPAAEEAKALARTRRFAALAKLKNVPAQFKSAVCACDCENCVNGDCANCTNEDCVDENCVDCPMQEGAGNRTAIPAGSRDEMEMKFELHRSREARRPRG